MYEVRTARASVQVHTKPEANRLVCEFAGEPVEVLKNGIMIFQSTPKRGKRHDGKGNKKGKSGRG